MSYELFIIGGSIFVTSAYIYHELYEKTRPTIEGKIIDANFTNEDNSRIKVQTENGDLDLIVETKKFRYGPLLNIGCGFNYKGRADDLAAFLPVGGRVEAKVEERQGLERRVYELLNVYLEPSRESRVILIGEFLVRLTEEIKEKFISSHSPPRKMDINKLETILRKSWNRETSYDQDNWNEDNPAWGQCAVTALVVQDYFGGNIVWARAKLPDGKLTSHYFNNLNGQEYDLTRDQFPEETVIPAGIQRTFEFPTVRNFVLSHEKTRERYELLKQRVQELI